MNIFEDFSAVNRQMAVNPLSDLLRDMSSRWASDYSVARSFAFGTQPAVTMLGDTFKYYSPPITHVDFMGKWATETSSQWSEAFNPFRGLADNALRASMPAMFHWQNHFADSMRETTDRLLQAALPRNARGMPAIRLRQIIDFIETQPTAIYLVPRAQIVQSLVKTDNVRYRREILGRRADDILDDCSDVLDECTDPELAGEVTFLREAITSARAGSFKPAQSLATVVLDATVRSVFTAQDRKVLQNREKGAPKPPAFDEFNLRELYVLLPIWNAHEIYKGHLGHTVPTQYNRHASVHSISRRQYTKRNTVQALMLGTSLIGYLSGL